MVIHEKAPKESITKTSYKPMDYKEAKAHLTGYVNRNKVDSLRLGDTPISYATNCSEAYTAKSHSMRDITTAAKTKKMLASSHVLAEGDRSGITTTTRETYRGIVSPKQEKLASTLTSVTHNLSLGTEGPVHVSTAKAAFNQPDITSIDTGYSSSVAAKLRRSSITFGERGRTGARTTKHRGSASIDESTTASRDDISSMVSDLRGHHFAFGLRPEKIASVHNLDYSKPAET
jgi:hypothetical protein